MMVAEIRKVSADDPRLAPYHSDVLDQSRDIWIGTYDGELMLVCGIVPMSLVSDTAYIWSVTNPEVKHYALSLLRESRRWLKGILQEFPILVGLCDCKTAWVKHLGAEFNPGANGLHTFTIRAR